MRYLTLFLTLFVSTAYAETRVCFSVESPNVKSGSCYVMADEEGQRLLEAYYAIPEYGRVQDGTDGDGQPIIRQRTPDELTKRIGDGLWAGMAAYVQSYFKEKAAREAAQAVPGISAKPQ